MNKVIDSAGNWPVHVQKVSAMVPHFGGHLDGEHSNCARVMCLS